MEAKTRVLIVSHYWPPHIGGVETVAANQAKYLACHGFTVSVLTSDVGLGEENPHTDDITVVKIKSANWFEKFGIPYPIFSPKLLMKSYQMVKDADVIIVHDSLYLNCVVTAILGKFKKKPCILIQHSPDLKYRFPWNVIKWIADRSLGKITYSLSTRICAVSEYTARFVRQFVGQKDIQVLHNGISLEEFISPSRSKNEIKEYLSLSDDQFVVLSVRRLVERNGIELLIECARRLRSMENISFVIVGDGPMRNRIDSQIAKSNLKNVHMVGFVEDAELANYYQMCDVYILPSISGEGFGLTVLEAFASGKPVITFSGSGADDIIVDRLNGFLIQDMDAGSMAEKILYISDNPSMLEGMADATLKKAASLTWNVNGEKLVHIIQDTVILE